jgi:hypothetical protein
LILFVLAHQHFLLLHKNSTRDVPVVSMSWMIIYANYIFSLYTFPFAHSKDDECDNDLTANDQIFNTPFFVLLNSSFTYVIFNNFASSSCLWLCGRWFFILLLLVLWGDYIQKYICYWPSHILFKYNLH